MAPINDADLDWDERERDGYEIRRKQLGAAAGGENLGCSLYELPAGNRSWPYHYHTANEEALYVLAGTATLRLDGEEHDLQAGDYVALSTGENSAHQVVNDGEEPIRYLAISEMNEPEVMGYPDSEKVGVIAGGAPGGDSSERSISAFFPEEAAVDYWDEE